MEQGLKWKPTETARPKEKRTRRGVCQSLLPASGGFPHPESLTDRRCAFFTQVWAAHDRRLLGSAAAPKADRVIVRKRKTRAPAAMSERGVILAGAVNGTYLQEFGRPELSVSTLAAQFRLHLACDHLLSKSSLVEPSRLHGPWPPARYLVEYAQRRQAGHDDKSRI